MSGESLLVSFLDLQGKDEPDAMVARLSVFRRAAPHKTDDTAAIDLTASLDLSAPGAPLPHVNLRAPATSPRGSETSPRAFGANVRALVSEVRALVSAAREFKYF